ncbi:1-phosphofructokinase family hexose kinase [Paraburkholderia strydomiana]|jgi:6-phosphofructokinase 2|uniref:1-phosphofructokinase family hexose kinase n=1 Tax=Paraburkholderia strydomiana TaxID=1245417 RepID=UPI0038B9D16B
MADIVTVTMNPAVDIATIIDRVIHTRKLRCAAPRRDPGGGGINVARVIQRLGADCTAVYLAGGVTGRILRQLLDAEEFVGECIEIAEETRENFCIFEQCTGLEYRFVLPGPTLTDDEWQRCTDLIDKLAVPSRYLVMSGSLPPGAPVDTYAKFARVAGARGTRVVLDTSGPALAAALQAGVWAVKPSLNELRDLTGRPLVDEAECIAVARGIVRDGRSQIVALTLGEQGALLVSADRCLRAMGLAVKVSSSIGAGDSFIAAFIWAMSRDANLDEAFRYGMAAASASLLQPGTALCERADIERCYLRISTEVVSDRTR